MRNHFSTILRTISFLFAAQGALAAPESSIEQRTSYNSQDQQSYAVSGTIPATPETDVTLTVAHSRTPLGEVLGTETYWFESLGASQEMDQITIDGALQFSQAPLTEIFTYGGAIGVAMTWTKSDDEKLPNMAGMSRIRAQFDAEASHETLFWTRFGLSVSNSTSRLIPGSSARETNVTLDFMVPMSDEFTLGGGASFYSYSDRNSYFDRAIRNSRNNKQALLGATLQGLPQMTFSTQLIASITGVDVFVPRYSATMIQTSRLWSHTLMASWRHEFSNSWALSPGYEITLQENLTTSGFLIDLSYYF